MRGRTKTMRGFVAITQEGRFGLIDDEGAGHLFVLSHASLAEPSQLAALQKRQARVRVRYTEAGDLLALVARSIELDEAA